MKLSVIVPVLNEVAELPYLFEQLRSLADAGSEVFIVDGNSQDGTVAQSVAAGFTVLQAPPGRALQMNAGAAAAQGDALLFLHADTRLPENATGLIASALVAGRCWGRFDVRISGAHPALRLVASMMNWRSRLSGIATGDQAIFVTRAVFADIGGFPEQPLMEDIEISRRLRELSPPVCISSRVLTSGRRWERHGVWRTILLMWRLRWNYWRGVPAERLLESYL